jgi:hypothetical protein
MKMTFRVIVIGGVIVFFAVVAVVVFIPSLVWDPPQTTVAHPYTPEQERGRELFYSNGCNYCHTQYVRAEDTAMGPVSEGGNYVFDNPMILGSERTGPDLSYVGRKRSGAWDIEHLRDPRRFSPLSVMPSFEFLSDGGLQAIVAYFFELGDRVAQERMVLPPAQYAGVTDPIPSVGRAIVVACPGPLLEAGEFQSLRGLGTSARIVGWNGRRVIVGSARFLGVDGRTPLAIQAQARAERGETVVWVGWDAGAAGFVSLRDEPNPTAREALAQLKEAAILSVMLSGDHPGTAHAIAAELGLAEYEGHCPPADKAARIRSWQTAGERVAMVGDGVNDAPALAQADLSVTVAGGTDVAGETSDVVLARSDLTLIPWFIALSRRTRQTILQNLGWAFAYNLISVPLAALGLISPAIAAVTMAASSLLVVGNSLRLRG